LEPLVRRDRQVFLVSRVHAPYYCEDLADASDSWLIEQPLNRGTGVAIALATVHVLLHDPDAIVCLFPCDHHYSDEESFRLAIRSATACAMQHPESIILFGAEAEYPEVEYGWIEPGAAVSEAGAAGLYRVRR
jgi:mannose-1-phosphate guanylyltransferase